MNKEISKINDFLIEHAKRKQEINEELFNLGVKLGRQLERDGVTDYRLPFFVEFENAESVKKKKTALISKAEKLILDVVKKAYKAEMDVSGAITIDASYSGRNDTHLCEDIVNRFFVKHTHTEQYHSGQDFTLTFLLQGNLLDIFQRHSVSPQVEITVSNNGGEEDETLYDAEDIDHQFFSINIEQHAHTTRLSVEELTAFVEDLEKNLIFLLIKGS